MKYTKIREVKSPTFREGDAGIDFYIPYFSSFTDHDFSNYIKKHGNEYVIPLLPNQSVTIPLGIKVNIPENMCMIFFNRSSVASSGLVVGACVIDSSYQGELFLNLHNISDLYQYIEEGTKIIQGIVLPIYEQNILEVPENQLYEKPSIRGDGGFGSTDILDGDENSIDPYFLAP